MVGLYSPSPSLASLGRDRRPTSSPPYPVFPKVWGKKKRAAPCRVHRRGQQVVVRPGDEPFYYPGMWQTSQLPHISKKPFPLQEWWLAMVAGERSSWI